MMYFTSMNVYRKVPWAAVRQHGGNISTAKWEWADTDKGIPGEPIYRPIVAGRELASWHMTYLYVAKKKTPIETTRFLLATRDMGQRARSHFDLQ